MSFFVTPSRNPLLIPGCTLWLDANHDASFSVDPVSGSIASWTSRDANARVFTPVSTAQEFHKLVRTKKKAWNDKNVVCLTNNSPTGLVCPSYDIASNFAANGTDITILMAIRTDEPSLTFGTLFYHYISVATGHYFRLNNSTGNARYLCLSTSQVIGGANTNYIKGYNIIRLQRTVNNLKCYINGALEQTLTSTATPIPVGSNAQMFIGTSSTSGGGGMIGDLRGLSMHARSLSDPEAVELENFYAASCLGIN